MSHSKQNNELNTISEIKFTAREIDIIACIFHNRGEKKIALLLAISPRTVNAHVHNIMLKIGHGSREHLIDFIEKSGKVSFIKDHYTQLLLDSTFKNRLIDIGKQYNVQGIICSLSYNEGFSEQESLLLKIKTDLSLARITLNLYINKEESNKQRLCIIKKENNFSNNIYILASDKGESDDYADENFIDFSNSNNYYFALLELLSKLFNNKSLNSSIAEFHKEYNSFLNIKSLGDSYTQNNDSIHIVKYKLDNKILLILGSILILLIIMGIRDQRILMPDISKDKSRICSDLPIPHENILLRRKSIISEMEEKLSNKDGIRTIALIGAGGSGKTTIARQFARKQNISVIWEINAETKASLISSLEQFAYALCKTPDERNELSIVQNLKDTLEQERRLILLLTSKLKTYSNWLIIYNNVNTFKDIRRYFPYDERVWGNGKVIITTCDSNIGFNSFIPAENIIRIIGLSKEKRLKLFNSIINEGKKTNDNPESVILDFIERIPPYPLDISLAAYCIKEAKLTYSEYLKYISEPKADFLSVQETVLNDMGEYNKTRYDIVALSIKQIINKHPEFKNLLLFISMINSESIPRDLLTAYKDNIAVSQFMHELRKFSLINENIQNSGENNSYFSIHRTTQTIALTYLIKELNLAKNDLFTKELSTALETYIIKEFKKNHFIKRPLLVAHAEVFLSHKNLLNKISASSLASKLGMYYFYIGAYSKAKSLLEESLAVYRGHYGEINIKTAEIFMRLGNVYRNMGDYSKAKYHLEQAFSVYKDQYGKDHLETSRVLTYLGSVHRNLGEYDKAKDLLEQVYSIYHVKYEKDNIQTARVSAYLGGVCKNLGDYKKAQELLEPALEIYKNYYGPEHAQTAWISVRLSNVYNATGEYTHAKKLIEEALQIYKKHHGENCIETAWSLTYLGIIQSNLGDAIKAKVLMNQSLSIYYDHFKGDHISIAWVLYNLGKIYTHLGEYDKAKQLLKQALLTHEKAYGKTHLQTANVLTSLGDVYLLMDDITTAEGYIDKALDIYKQITHPDIFLTLESFADINMKKSVYALTQGNMQQEQYYKNHSIISLKKALEIAKKYFPEKSPHIKRIISKLQNLEAK